MLRSEGQHVAPRCGYKPAVGHHRVRADDDLPSREAGAGAWWCGGARGSVQKRKEEERGAATEYDPLTSTLLTRAIIAKAEASAISVVEIPASASEAAVACPSPPGAVSATITSKTRFLCAALRNASTVRSRPCVRMTCHARVGASAAQSGQTREI